MIRNFSVEATDEFLRDLNDCLKYLSERRSVKSIREFQGQLLKKIKSLQQFPYIAPRLYAKGINVKDFRRLTVQQVNIVYRVLDTHRVIELISLYHQSWSDDRILRTLQRR